MRPLPTIWEIPDELWERIEPILAARYPSAATGRPRADRRLMLDGIQAYEESARERAAEGAQRAGRAGLNAQPRTRARDSTIAATILAEADEVGARAIVLGTRGLTGVKSLWLGSVSHAVLQHADRPVIVFASPEVAHERASHRR